MGFPGILICRFHNPSIVTGHLLAPSDWERERERERALAFKEQGKKKRKKRQRKEGDYDHPWATNWPMFNP